MLPEGYKQKVDDYRMRLVNFKANRRKGTAVRPSPELLLREKGTSGSTDAPSCE